MSNIVSLASYRQPVTWTIRFTQDYEGGLSILVENVADDPRSRLAVATALRQAADTIDESVMSGDNA